MEYVLILVILVLALWYYIHVQELVEGITKNFTNQFTIQQSQNAQSVGQLQEVISELNRERTSQEANMSKMVNALIAKNAAEARDLNLTDKVLPITAGKPEPEAQPDLVSLDSLTDEQWDEHIQAQLLGGSEADSVGVTK